SGATTATACRGANCRRGSRPSSSDKAAHRERRTCPAMSGVDRCSAPSPTADYLNVLLQPLVEKIDGGADPRGVADPLMGEEPQNTAVVFARWQAADQVRVAVADQARQDGDAEARAHPR